MGILLLLLVVFYRPIIFAVVKAIVPGIAAKQHLKVDFDIGGSIFTNLHLDNVHVTPTAPSPFEKLDVGHLELRYSLLTFLRRGLNSPFIKDVTLHDAYMVYDPSKSPPSPPKKKEPFSLPSLPIPQRLSLRNVNFLMRPDTPEGARATGQNAAASSVVPAPAAPAVAAATESAASQGLLVQGATLELDPDRSGELRLGELRIPGGPDLTNVSATTSFRDRDLRLTDVNLAPEIHLRLLEINASKLEQQILDAAIDADRLLGGNANITLGIQGLGKPPDAKLALDINALSLPELLKFNKLDLPLTGTLDKLHVDYAGNTDQPKTWTGRTEIRAGGLAYGDTTTAPVDNIDLRATYNAGTVDVEDLGVVQGGNKIAGRAHVVLTERMDDLVRSEGRGTLEVDAPDFTKLPVKLPQEIRGALHANDEFTLSGGKVTSLLKARVQNLAVPAQRAAVSSLDLVADTTKVLPENATAAPVAPGAPPPPHLPFYDRLQSKISATVEGIAYADYRVDNLKLALTTDQANVKLDSLELNRGPNKVNVAGTYVIPEDFGNAQKQPLAADLSIALPDVSQFSADPQTLPLRGLFNAKGNVTAQNGVYGGGLNLQIRDLQAKGATVQTGDVVVAVENGRAVVKTGRIVLDDRNTIDLSGNAGLAAPYPFEGGLTVDLADLGRLNPVLAANGTPDAALGGNLKIAANVHGHLNTTPDAKDQQIDGTLDVTARNLQAKGAKIESVDTQIVIADNHATVKTGQIKIDPKSAVTFGGNADLAAPYTFQGNLNVDLPDLGAFNSLLATPLAKGKGEDNHGDKPAPTPTKLGGSFRLAAQASGHLNSSPDAHDQRVDGTVDINGANITANSVKIQRIEGNIVAANNAVTIRNLLVRIDDKNAVNIDGRANAAAPYDYDLSLNVNIADLAKFEPLLLTPQKEQQTAKAEMEAASSAKTPPSAQINAPGKTASRDTVVVPNVTTNTSAGKVKVAVRGKPGTPGMRAEIIQPTAPKVGGSIQMNWKAKGDFDKTGDGPHFSGGGKIAAHGVVYNTFGPLEADVQGQYSQLAIDFPTIFVSANGFELRSTFALKDALARLDNLHFKQGNTELLSGYAQIPVDLTKLSAPGGPIPDEDKIDVNIASKPLPIGDLVQTTGAARKSQAPPIKGTVALEITAHGSLSKIVAGIKVEARGLASTQLATVRPADADFHLTLHDNRLDLDTVVRQPQIAPLTIKGNLPVDLKAIAEKKSLDPNSPVTLSIQLPRSSLAFLQGATKALRFIQGDAAADVRVGGTIDKPTLAGSLELNIPAARAENITVPAIRDFRARLAFTEKQLRFERFNGEIGGGRINLSGNVGFAKLSEPTLDLSATARDVLGARDDNLTVRVNADVRVNGPLAAATVSGHVGLTKSRYLKEIDIIPINLPGKPAPAPPASAPSSSESEGPGAIAVNSAPVKDWKFNVDIRTDDPFFIRGNLANGQALVDLHLRGTGAQPLLDGNVVISNLVASLPFSRLEISEGNINFTPDQPLNPVLNLTGTSTIRNYLVSVYITGRSKDPKITFSSDPPLGQEQIVSLLATGATTDELTGDAQGLAGKATLLVLQDLYRRTFKKKESARQEPKESLADKVNLDVGATDPATGKQEVSAGFKINDRVQFVADLGIQGDLRGRVKYLVRFR